MAQGGNAMQLGRGHQEVTILKYAQLQWNAM